MMTKIKITKKNKDITRVFSKKHTKKRFDKHTRKISSKKGPTIKEKLTRINSLPITKMFTKVFTDFVIKPLRQEISQYARDLKNQPISLEDHKSAAIKSTALNSVIPDNITTNTQHRQTHLTESNWLAQRITELAGMSNFKGGKLLGRLPISSYLRTSKNVAINARPYNSQVSLKKLINEYRTQIRKHGKYYKWYDKKKISAFVSNKYNLFKRYKFNLKHIAGSTAALPYNKTLGQSLGKLNLGFLPWIRKRGETRTHFFRSNKGTSVYNDGEYACIGLLSKRPSRLFKLARLKLNTLLTDKHRQDYVLARIRNYPIKTQNSFLNNLSCS